MSSKKLSRTIYDCLGVLPTATDEELKAAYKRACMQLHPDRGGSVEEFQELQAAFNALKHRVCPECGNTGRITERRGFFVDTYPCPRCWTNQGGTS